MGNTDLSSLTKILHDTLNKKHKTQKVAYFLDEDIYTPTDVRDWLSTGSSVLDLAVANVPNGGIPYGRITELQGLEGSGKSLIGAHLLASNQKQGGISIYIDTETSVFRPFLEVIGVDLKKLLYVRLSLVEDIFETIENMIVKVRESNKDIKLAILVDSLAGATTKVEQESDYDKDGWSTAKAIITSKAMRKINDMIGTQNIALIFTQQLRVNLGVTFGDKYCVDPYTTKIKVRYNKQVEEIVIAEFAERFIGINDFITPEIYDLSTHDIEIYGKNQKTGKDCYNSIKTFVVKPSVETYWTDGKLNGTNKHTIIENNNNICLEDHKDFSKVNKKMEVVDFEIDDSHNYYANGRLNHNTTSGGKALGFHSSVRIRLDKSTKIYDKRKDCIGMNIKAKIIKNRLGPPLRIAVFQVYFDRGIDDLSSWLQALKDRDIITVAGAWYSITLEDGTVKKFQSKNWGEIMSDKAMYEYIYGLLCDAYIMKYKPKEVIDIDEIVISDEAIEGD